MDGLRQCQLALADVGLSLREDSSEEREGRIVSDVVIENMSPGSLERAGLGYEDLRRVKPDIVMLAMSGAGQFGPLSCTPVGLGGEPVRLTAAHLGLELGHFFIELVELIVLFDHLTQGAGGRAQGAGDTVRLSTAILLRPAPCVVRPAFYHPSAGGAKR